MIGARSHPDWGRLSLVEVSPLRRADPRTRLALAMCASLAVMLPLQRLILFVVLYAVLLIWARLLSHAARQVWRLRWLLIALFVVDWLVISLDLAVIVSLRLVLVSSVFALFVGTTTPEELRLALEWMRIPHRYAFTVGLAFQSVELLAKEWNGIREAQQARGAWSPAWSAWRKPVAQVREMVSLTVPSIVLAVQRAWAMTEAACARGLESPHRRPYGQLNMGRLDWVLLSLVAIAGAALLLAKGWMPLPGV